MENKGVENNIIWQDLKTMEGNIGIKEVEELIYRGLYLHRNNILYVRDMYKLIIKKVKPRRAYIGNKTFNVIGDKLIKNTGSRFNQWYIDEEFIKKVTFR